MPGRKPRRGKRAVGIPGNHAFETGRALANDDGGPRNAPAGTIADDAGEREAGRTLRDRLGAGGQHHDAGE